MCYSLTAKVDETNVNKNTSLKLTRDKYVNEKLQIGHVISYLTQVQLLLYLIF